LACSGYWRLPPIVQGCLHRREILPVRDGLGVVGAKARLMDRKRTFEQRAGAVEVALAAQDDAEVVEDGGGPGMVGAQGTAPRQW
jgi:hypothetical protein